MSIEEKIWGYVVGAFLGGKTTLNYKDFVFDSKMDSLSHVKLIFFLEKEFKISLDPEEMRRDEYNTVEKIAELVRKKGGSALGG